MNDVLWQNGITIKQTKDERIVDGKMKCYKNAVERVSSTAATKEAKKKNKKKVKITGIANGKKKSNSNGGF